MYAARLCVVPVASFRLKSYRVRGEANAQTPEVKEARRRKPAAATPGDGMVFKLGRVLWLCVV